MGISRVYFLKVLFVLLISGFAYFFCIYGLVGKKRSASGTPLTDGIIHSGHYAKKIDVPFMQFDDSDPQISKKGPYLDNAIDVAMIFAKAQGNKALAEKFSLCLSSMLQYSSRPINLHLISDEESLDIAKKLVDQEADLHPSSPIMVFDYDADVVGARTDLLVADVKKYFMYKPGAYYSDSLFFFSIIMHKVFLKDRIILLDVDLKFRADIAELERHFDLFLPENIIGLAKEQQPVYRHIFHMYRKDNPETVVGNPPPHGFPGFNSAVVLLDLQRMRNSPDYAKFLNTTYISNLVRKYKFQGHLGDQDFFTLVSLENAQLFYILPCGWNRQLCQWWKVHGYDDVFESYHQCNELIKILHGNCNTPIPQE